MSRDISAIVPLTPTQHGMLVDALSDEGAYVEQLGCTIEGPFDVARFEAAWRAVIARHDALRTSFAWKRADTPMQAVHEAVPFAVDVRAAESLDALLVAERARGLDLAKAPVMRVAVAPSTGGHHVVWTHHHMLLDGWSVAIVLEEVLEAYAAPTKQRPRGRPFKEYVTWLGKRRDVAAAEAFWRSRFADAPAGPSLSEVVAGGGERAIVSVSATLPSAPLAALARREGVTLSTLVQAAWALIVARTTGRDDVVFGVTSAGRPAELEGVERMVGLFIVTLPLRVRLGPHRTVRALLHAMREDAAAARPYEHTPLVDVHAWAGPAARVDGTVVFESYPLGDLARGPLPLADLRIAERTTYPWMLVVGPGAELSIRLDVDASRITPEVARGLVDALVATLQTFDAEASLDAVIAPSVARGPAAVAPSFVDAILAQAAGHPAKVAIVCGEERLTYGALVARARAIAEAIPRGANVGVAMRRGVELPCAMLGVLLAGAAYVPLDLDGPRARASAMVTQAEVTTIVCDAQNADAAAAFGTALCVDAPLVSAPASPPQSDLAYVLFTSGSTGVPKGVAVRRASVDNLLAAMNAACGVGPDDVWLAVTPITFDIAALEIFGPLVAGATVHLATETETRDGALLGALAASSGATVMQATPSTWRMVLDAGAAPRLRAIAGGEGLSASLAARLLEVGPVWNAYGPTETTIWSTIHRVEAADTRRAGTVPIGRPLAETEVRVVDAAGRPVPIGAAGELWIGGAGVAAGYVGDRERTRARFVDGGYLTGDRVRMRGDGVLVWLGRDDGQIKLRGVRVELGEVEAALERCPGVTAAAVTVSGEGEMASLTAWVVGDNEGLRAALRSFLPEALLPSRVVSVAALPQTPHGKIDRRALAALDTGDRAPRVARAPEGAIEHVLHGVFCHVLGRETFDVEASFFAEGGHSLLATQVLARVRRAFGVELAMASFFRAPTIRAQAALVAQLRGGEASSAPRAPLAPRASIADDAPLTFTQSRLWFIDQLEPENPFYNLPAAVRLSGPLDRARLQEALDAVVARQTSLRTTFFAVDGVPRQRVQPPSRVPVAWIDMRGNGAAAVEAVAREEVRRPFDLGRDLLLRVAVLQVGDAEHVIVLTMAHIAADGWSIGILVRELAAAYGGATLGPLAITVADVAAWQASWSDDGALARIAATLEGAPVLALPTDRPRPPVQRFRGARVDFALDAATHARLKTFARGASVTPFMALLAAFDGLLMMLSGQRDVSVGVPIANRTEAALEPIVGFFANTLVVRTEVGEDARLVDLLEAVRASSLAAFDAQDVPFERLVARLDPERDRARSPLFQAMFVFQTAPRGTLESAGLAFTPMEPSTGTSKVDLELTMMEHEGRLLGSFEYDTDLFDAATVQRWAAWFERLVAAMLDDPKRVLADVPLASPEERALERRWLTGETRGWDLSGTVMAHIEAAVDRAPDRIALVEADGATITYRALDRRANAQARALEAQGVQEGDLVGVAMDRSIGLLVAILGVLKAGAAWVPLEPDLPEARRARMAAATKLVLVDAATDEAPRAGRALRGDALAYVIHTSGSTGQPKGVMSEHRGLLNRLLWMQETFALGPDDVVVQKTPIGFDVSVWELLWPLMTGARMVLAKPGGHRDPDHLAALFTRHGVTTAHFVPSMLGAMLDAGAGSALRGLRRLVCSGEALTPSLVRRVRAHAPELPIHNLYGPTEASIDVTHHRVAVMPDEVPIGRPIANTYLRVLDARGRPVLPGVAGELCLGGVQLARGYLDDPEGTAARFVADPDDPRRRIYRTGDRVRLRADGELLYLGRLDEQVKIRGVRVELGEIEAALVEHPEIRDAAVAIDGDALVAWVSPRRDALAEEPAATRVAAWAGIFDEAYRDAPADPTLHLGGWTSSFDGSAIPEAEMRRWVDATVTRVRALGGRSVLEIGAGTGLVTTRLGAERHLATDISRVAVERLRQIAPSVSVVQAAADTAFDERFDVCVLSSVVQYFPSATYLERVLANAIDHVVDGGAVFVGDVRNLALDAAFRRALGKPRDEDELLLDPRFFWALRSWPRVASVTVTPKGGDDGNEMTTYRYDVVLRVGPPVATEPPRTVPWTSLDALDALAGERVVVTGIPNARFVPGGVAPERLFERGGDVSFDPADLEHGALTVAFGGAALAPACAPSPAWSNRPWEAARLRTLPRRAKEHLRARLPEVMVPRAIGVLDELPRTASGKVDKKALAARGLERAPRREAVILPRSEREALVASAFAELLGVERVSVDDSFFDLGGHSLLATRLVARLGRGLDLRAVFESPTVEGIARALGSPEERAATAVLPRHPETRAPLSFAQRRMVVLDALATAPGLYAVPLALRVRGALDVGALSDALSRVVARHEPLRTRIVAAEPEPVQEVLAPWPVVLEPIPTTETALRSLLDAEARVPFDLAAGRPFRARLYRLRDEDHVLALTTHHVATDRWSLDVLAGDLVALLRGDVLPPLPRSYRDWAAFQRSQPIGGLDAWRSMLEGAPAAIALPFDRPRTASRAFEGARHRFAAPAVDALARALDATPFMIHLAALATVLQRAGAGDDLVIGAPIAGRVHADLEPLVGLFVNTLPLRVRPEPALPFDEHVRRVRATTLRAFAHQAVPFEAIVDAVAPARSLAHDALVQVMLVVQNVPRAAVDLPGAVLSVVDVETGTSKTDLTLFVEGDSCVFEYDRALFDPETVASLASAYAALLADAAKAPSRPLEALALPEGPVLRGERAVVPSGTILGAIRARAEASPHAIAIVEGARAIDYVTLLAEVDAMAARLAVAPGARVGVALPRSIEAVVAVLAALVAGAAWVPLAGPRRAAIEARAGLAAVVTPEGVARGAGAPGEPDVAYVLFTSGTTGAPKGVVVPRSALENHMAWMAGAFPLGAADRVLFRTSLAFDASVWELFAPLMAGATMVIADEATGADPAALLDLVTREGVTVLQLVPTLLGAVLAAAPERLPSSLRRVFAGGEALSEPLRRAFFARSGATLVNLYGPTEATIDATAWVCDEGEGPTPIGRPIANMHARVLDARGVTVPLGFPGELWLGGAGLARGYLGDATATRERFVTAGGERLYRTGDRVRQRPRDGALVYLGRDDDQVKVGGVRVELGEIEAILASVEGVEAAAASLHEGRLVAHVVGSIDPRALREAVTARLPVGVAAIVPIATMPRTANGKIDRAALPAPEASLPDRDHGDAPADAKERAIARVFAEVLGTAPLPRDADFFGLGGDSIQSLYVVSRARAAGLSIRPRDVFEAPSVAALAARAVWGAAPVVAEAEDRPFPLAPTQRWFFALGLAARHHWNQSVMVDLDAPLDRERLAAAVRAVVRHHPMLRARFGDGVQWIAPDDERCFVVGGAPEEIQASLDLERGPVFRVALVTETRLLLVAHHLVVDAVSWGVVQEDLLAAYAGSPLAPAVPYAAWARAVADEATPQGPPRDPRATERTARTVTVRFTPEETARIVRARERVLLAALAFAIANDTEGPVPITVESHGRDGTLDVSRTVGWLTQLRRVEVPPDATVEAAGAALERARAHVGGALAPVVLNYLGRLDAVASPGARPSEASMGPIRSPDAVMPFALDVTGGVRDGALTVIFTASDALYDAPSMTALVGRFASRARALATASPETPEARLPLTPMQEGMLFDAQLAPGVYVQQVVCTLEGTLDVGAFRAAWDVVVARHDALRAAFDPGDAKQWIVAAASMPVTEHDVDEAAFERILEADRARGFDLARPPAMRVLVARARTAGTTELRVVLSHHHVVLDGWSLPIVLGDVFRVYAALVQHTPIVLPPAPSFAAALPRLLAATAKTDGALAGFSKATALPLADRPGPSDAVTSGEVSTSFVEVAQLEARARAERVTLASILDAAWALLLARHAGTSDVVFGVTVAGRPPDVPAGTVGMFVATVPLRVQIEGEPLSPLFAQVHRALGRHGEDAHVPIAAFHAESDVPAAAPLFESVVVVESFPVDAAAARGAPGFRIRAIATRERTSTPLTLVVAPAGTSTKISVLFDRARFSEHAARTILARYAEGLGAIARGAATTREVTFGAGRRAVRPPSLPVDETLSARFARVALAQPDAVAVVHEGVKYTYRDLAERAGGVARALGAHGVARGDRVAVFVERSIDLVAAVLGTLAAGAAYVPLDPRVPALRRRFQVDDAKPRAIVVDAGADAHGLPAIVPGARASLPASTGGPDDLAYVIYTSGSTGTPKGTLVTHRNVMRLFEGAARVFEPGPRDVWSFAHSIAFDFSVWEIFGALLYGGAVVVVPDDVVRAPDRFRALVAEAGVTMLSQTPSAFEAFDAADAEQGGGLERLRAIVFGGEALRVPRLAGWLARHGDARPRLVNMYGITETTVHVTVRPITREDLARAAPNESVIGRPLPDLAVEVRDADGAPVPDGVPGELWVGGDGVARGYLARPELTAARFVDGWYRTGDRGRRDLDGELVHLGRLDDQVKIRGFRVELGEIEAVLEAHPEVRAAAVVLRGERLVAFVAGTARPDALRAHAAARLYEAMVPAAFVVLDALPLTVNGKIDRARLVEPDATLVARGRTPRPLRDPRSALVAAIWAEVLGREDVDDDADVFTLGAHSLVAARAVARLRRVTGRDVPLKALFAHPTPRGLAAALEGAAVAADEGAIPRAPGPLYPLSLAQERLWFIERLAGRSDATIPAVVRFRGAIDPARARAAWRTVVQRHAALRTVFVEEGGVPRQRVREEGPALVLAEGDVEARVREESARPFDLENGPLARAFLFAGDPEGPVFFLAIHHIVADGWSLGVLVRDFAVAYQGGVLPPLRVDYPDFAAWQRARAVDDPVALAFFRDALAGAPPLLDWPDDAHDPRAPVTTRGDEIAFALTLDETRALEARSRAAGTTMFMTVLAALEIFLARISGQDDVSVGVSVAGRSHPDTEPMVGFFVNLVVVRARLARERTVNEALADTRARVLDSFAHQDVPFERVVSALRPARNVGEAPLFQVNLVYQNLPRDGAAGALALEPVFVPSAVARFDLVVTLDEPRGGPLRGTFVFRTDRFARETVARFIAQYRATLVGIAHEPSAEVFSLPLGEPPRRDVVPAGGPLLADRIAAQAPDAIAVAHGDVTVTYRELLARAARLRGRFGGHRRVAIVMEARVARVAAVVAALSAGVAFVPIDPREPLPRMASMFEAAAIGLVVTDAETEDRLPATSAEVIVIDDACAGHEAPPRAVSGDEEAYVVFTSGSTGVPKGVRIGHAGLANLADAQIAAFGVGPADRVLAFASFGFDAAISELAMALGSGATLDLGPEGDGVRRREIAGVLRARAITTVTLPPSLLRVTDPADLPALRAVIAAGEPCHADVAARWARGRRFFNAYGPTETTVCATIGEVTSPLAPGRVAIGRAMQGLDVRVVDGAGRDVPCGVAGEIWVGGVGVALGYLGGASEAFVEQGGVRFYRTGDLARRRPDGALEFLRRVADDQVKVRGFRIELGEVERALASHPAVEEAAAAVREERLVAYVVSEGGADVDAEALAGWVAARLPAHMVPSDVVALDVLPRTTSGKVDRKSLPTPSREARRPARAPLAGLEAAMATAWAAVLGSDAEGIGRDDDFFALGGHSLLAAQLVARVREALGAEVPLATIFEAPTLGAFTAAVAGSTSVHDRVTPCDRRGPLPLSFAQERLWVLDQLEASSAYVLVTRLALRGPLDRGRLERALDALVARHEPLRSRIVAEHGVPRVVIDPPGEARRHGPIDLARGPVFALAIEARAADLHVIELALHHAVADAATVEQLVADLGALYEGRALPPLALQYVDWAAFERRHAGDGGLAFWRDELAGAPATLGVGRSHDAPSYRAARRVATLPRRAIEEAARRARVTPFMVLEAAFAAVLARLGGRDDVVIGTPMTARPHPDTAGMVGLFMNTLALRTRLGAARTLGDLLATTRAVCLRAYAHADTPFERVAAAVTTERHLHQNPVFQAMFTLQARAPAPPSFSGLEAELLETPPGDAKLDLSLAVGTRDDVYDVFLEHRVDVVDDALAARVLDRFLAVANKLATSDEATPLEALMDEGAADETLEGPRDPFPPTFLDDVRAQVARRPDHLAVVARDGTRTYRELLARAEALAATLRARGVSGRRVAIAVPRGVALVETLLGVLAAGAAYVPLGEARAAAIARIASPALRIDGDGLHALDGGGGSEGAAYVLFTSGSTGEPKGVEIGHAALSNLLRSLTGAIALGDDDVMLASTPLGFDIAALELFGPLVVGATVRIATEQELRDPRVLFAGAPRPTVVQATPSTWRVFLDAGADLAGIRKLSGGEALTTELARELARTGGALWNVYGPTETTIWSTIHRVTELDLATSIPLGRPIANTTLRLRADGELVIGGVGLGRYLGAAPLESTPGWYRTGDRVRVREDGAWIWSGREDRQVKVRGHRVELGEIEAALRARGAKEALAMLEGDAIVAFVTGGSIGRDALAALLPEATIPARIVALDAFPLTAHGKVDHAALRRSGVPARVPARRPSRPLDADEARVAAIWARLLGRPVDDPETSFFEAGGHSLLAARLVAAVRDELAVDVALRTVFVAPTLRAFTGAVRAAMPGADPSMPSIAEGPRPASFAEERMWLLAQVDRDDPSYHLPLAVRLRGPLDVARLRDALGVLVARHATLRTRFAWNGEALVATPMPPEAIALAVDDVVDLDRWLASHVTARLDPTEGPIWRARLARLAPEEHVLFVVVHHIAVDAWSMRLLARELAALVDGETLAPLPTTYAAFAAWQRAHAEGHHAADLAYWQAQLEGVTPLELPTDRPRTRGAPRGGIVTRRLDRAAADAMRAFGVARGATPFMTFFAAWAAVLGRNASTRDVTVGVPVGGRPTAALEQVVGLFVNTVALRVALGGSPAELVARAREATLGGLAHADAPFAEVVRAVDPPRDATRTPIFQTMFMLHARSEERESERVEVANGGAAFELTLALTERADGAVDLTLEHREDLFERASAERLLAQYAALVEAFPLAADADAVALGPPAVLTGPPRTSPVVRRDPSAVAVRALGASMTYAALDAEASRIATVLRERGVRDGSRVLLRMERSPRMIAAILGVWWAGGAYVAVDADWPEARIAWIRDHACVAVTITDDGIDDVTWERVARAATAEPPHPPPDAIAYVLYTSGSSGEPKGVEVPHACVSNLADAMRAEMELGPGDRVLQFASLAFDASVEEIAATLASGATLVLREPGPVGSVQGLLEAAEREGVTVLDLPTAFWHAWCDEAPERVPATLRLVVVGGEAASRERLARFRAGPGRDVTFLNTYGPTEATVTATAWRLPPGAPVPARVPIGAPIAGVSAYVLDDARRPVTEGVPGTLFLGGAGVARGYLGDLALTRARFVDDPFGGGRMFDTGDRVRLRDGALEFLGRNDAQIKVRGHRVEPTEVEAALVRHEAVREAAVALDGARLAAWIVLRGGPTTPPPRPEVLQAHLRKTLPEAFVPAVFVTVDALPMSAAGKIDRRRLPAPGAVERAHVAPRTPLESEIAGLFGELLGHATISVEDDFFTLGGHSLLATQLLSRVRTNLGVDLPVRALFEAPTVAGLAARVLAARVADDDALLAELEGMTDEEAAARLAALESDDEGKDPA